MGTVNRVPRGFLGLLDAKTLGRTPPDVEPSLRAQIDLTPNYLADIPLEIDQASGLISSTGSTQGIVTVPDFTLWYVYVICSEFIATAASQAIQGCSVLIAPSGTINVPLQSHQSFAAAFAGSVATGDSNQSVWTSADPLLLGPGTQLGSRLTLEPGAANVNCVTSVAFRAVSV